MFCDRCGTKLTPHAAFCASCGKTLIPMLPSRNRVEGHVRMLGILWLAYAAFHASPGLAIWAFFSGGFLPDGAPPFLFHLFPMIGALLIITGLLAGVVGVGLLLRQSWARMAAIVVGAINLTSLPFGTALGIYTLWVLLPSEHEREYREMSLAA